MNTRLFSAAFAGAVVSFLSGWLIWGYLMADFYATYSLHYNGLEKIPPNLVGIFAGGLVNALLLSAIFSKWARITTFVEGAKAGAWISLLITLSIDLYLWSTMNMMGKRVLVADVLLNTAIGVLVGGVIGWVLGYKKSS